jgi:hypothetical protein
MLFFIGLKEAILSNIYMSQLELFKYSLMFFIHNSINDQLLTKWEIINKHTYISAEIWEELCRAISIAKQL